MTAIIGFDTATEQTVVGATLAGKSVFEFRSGPGSTGRPAHSEELLPAIEGAVEALGGWNQVDLVGVGVGPGTYTGLRIAIATARGLALAGVAEVVGVPTLEAMAHSIQNHEPAPIAVPVLDAKRGEAFFGAWNSGGEELHPASVGPPSDLVELVSRLPDRAVLAGPGAVLFRSELSSGGLKPAAEDDPSNRLEGSAICELAGRTGKEGRQERIEPIYLRAPDAERWTGTTRSGD